MLHKPDWAHDDAVRSYGHQGVYDGPDVGVAYSLVSDHQDEYSPDTPPAFRPRNRERGRQLASDPAEQISTRESRGVISVHPSSDQHVGIDRPAPSADLHRQRGRARNGY